MHQCGKMSDVSTTIGPNWKMAGLTANQRSANEGSANPNCAHGAHDDTIAKKEMAAIVVRIATRDTSRVQSRAATRRTIRIHARYTCMHHAQLARLWLSISI